MTDAVLLDLDGTLTDPREGITGCIRHALCALGRPVPEDDDLTWCIGPPLLGSFERLLGDAALAPRGLALYRERFGEVGLYENELYPGTVPMLAALRARGARAILATSKPRVFAERILDHFALTPFFAAIHGSELDGTRAEKTALLPWIVAREGVDPARSVMLGDRSHDMLGARAAGLRGVGALYGFGGRDELLDSGAAHLIDAPEGLIGVL
jgi:phosphoglycolate phosphatase